MRTTFFAAILTAVLLALLPATAHAAPPSGAHYISDDDWGGYVDVSNIRMNGETFSFVATIETTRGAIPVNPLYFVAKAADGTTYDDPDYTYTNLHSGRLPVGERVKGTIAFTTAGPRPTVIQYEGPLGDVLTKWTFTWRSAPKTPKPAPPFGSSS